MRFEPTAIAGAWIVHTAPHVDARGSFARTFCAAEFAAAGIDFTPVQLNLSRNPHRHTLRGLHGNHPPHEEAKLVQCVRGHVFDVAVDLRPGSPTRLAHVGVDLPASGDTLFYIPPGCLHGFLTLTPDSDVLYHMGSAHMAGAGYGLRWNDPALGIAWPAAPALISERDAGYPDFAG
ncbi:dTDP-4-dehydrorhamnose 3,5-epimerase family protein [Polymorphobacter sp.]|uniref:dTDP-4-dehydrorhamnose 3,5-epimerase family protein n=1 Tax=Polymorphobacter sp. TaxID=1909290 RepID=UPI003F70032E